MSRGAVRAESSLPKEDFAALLDESLGKAQGFEGTVVQGRVVGVVGDFAVVDVGLKSEGRIPLREFSVPGQVAANINVGDTVEVFAELGAGPAAFSWRVNGGTAYECAFDVATSASALDLTNGVATAKPCCRATRRVAKNRGPSSSAPSPITSASPA